MSVPERDRRGAAEADETPLDKKDTAAMYISGLLVIGLPCLLLVLLIAGITILLFGR